MKNLFIPFILNLFFSLFEFVGGILSGSTAITSDALHDFGDAMTIGISLFLEKKSQKPADELYNFGYGRFSLLGGFITCAILLAGSFFAFLNGINRLFNPTEINVDLTLIFAIFGFLILFLPFSRSAGIWIPVFAVNFVLSILPVFILRYVSYTLQRLYTRTQNKA